MTSQRSHGRAEVEVSLRAEAIVGEGPVWSQTEGVLYWVDILGQAVHRFCPLSGRDEVFDIPGMPGCIVPRAQGGFLAAVGQAIYAVDEGFSWWERWAEPEGEGRRFNDGKCDPQGRFWVGSMDLEQVEPIGSLYRLGSDRLPSVVLPGLVIANGLDWSLDHRTFYFTDSGRGTIYRFAFDPDTGHVSGQQVFATIPPEHGIPDGLCVDADGCVWAAHWDGGRITRFDPDGVVDRVVQLPVPRPTSVAFGGIDLDVLYVTTARYQLSPAQLKEAPLSGSVLAVHVDGVRGRPAFAFAG